MADGGATDSNGHSSCNQREFSESHKSQEDECSSAPDYSQDLKSVLVTSVLNLEELDVDLYR